MNCLHLFKLLLATIVLVSGFSRTTATKFHFEEYDEPANAIDFGDGHAPSYLMDPSIIVAPLKNPSTYKTFPDPEEKD